MFSRFGNINYYDFKILRNYASYDSKLFKIERSPRFFTNIFSNQLRVKTYIFNQTERKTFKIFQSIQIFLF